ncbi:MAG: hypothetical protein KBC36_06050 [Spirochaetia bacterium]|nr:hypothetical protein [Spirochaetia bacterium]
MARGAVGGDEAERARGLALRAFEALVPRRGGSRDLTTRELVQATGLPEHELLALLPALAAEYGAAVAATDSGEVLWRFPGHLEPRRPREGARSLAFRRAAREFGGLLARAALAVAYAPWAFFSWGFLAARARRGAWTVNGRRTGFYEVVFSFVFGGARDPEAERRARSGADFLAWAATRGGLASASEYALREGLEPEEAGRRLAGYAALYGGAPEALGPGLLAWRFPLPPGTLPALPPPVRRAPKRFSENTPEWDAVAAGVGASGLASGALVAVFALSVLAAEDSGGSAPWFAAFLASLFGLVPPAFTFWAFGIVPALGGLLGLAVPAARALAVSKENRRRRREDALVRAGAALLELADVEEPVARLAPGRDAEAGRGSDASIRAAVETIAACFGAELDGEDGGWTVYRFPRLGEEFAALRAARASRPPLAVRKGRVVFDSGTRLGARKP